LGQGREQSKEASEREQQPEGDEEHRGRSGGVQPQPNQIHDGNEVVFIFLQEFFVGLRVEGRLGHVLGTMVAL
jgi:hypothetical protein